MSGNDLWRMTRNRITMSAPSKKSVMRRRKNGHLTLRDRSYHTFMCVVHQASIGLREDDEIAAVAAAVAAATPAAAGSFAESTRFDASKLVVVVVVGIISIAISAQSCRIRIGKGDSVDLTVACLDNPS